MQLGEVAVHALSDGTFLARPSYFGAEIPPSARPDVFDRGGAASLPIGCFLVEADGRLVLVDTGLGPEVQHLPDGMFLAGGQLPTALSALAVDPAAITDVVCTHLHADHVGWLFTLDARRAFSNAIVWAGRHDLDHFVDGEGEMAAHVREGFRSLPRTALRALEADASLSAAVTVLMAPGHTPGSLALDVHGGGRRLLLVGDALTHPVQRQETTWHSIGDVQPEEAARTRAWLLSQLARPSTSVLGSHFPLLCPLTADERH